MHVTVTYMLPIKLTLEPATETIFDALGNPVRRRMLAELGAGPLSVGELAERFAVSRPAISRHLALLETANLVRHETIGTRHLYRLEASGFERTTQWLGRFWDEAEARLRLVAENLDPSSRSGSPDGD